MAITEYFKKAVQSNNIMQVRIMLKDSLLIDPTFVQFDQMEKYALSMMKDLYVPHNGEKMNFDAAAWNKNYLNQQMVCVVNSFSRERIELLKSMVEFLYKNKADKIRQSRKSSPVRKNSANNQAGTGIAAIGAVVAIGGIFTSHTWAVILGAAAAVAGIALNASNQERKR